MRKNYVKNFIHLILILIPILMLFICVLQPLKNADGGDITTDSHTETTVNYAQTNEINTINDIVIGNVYKLNYGYLYNIDGYGIEDVFSNLSINIIGTKGVAIINIDTTNDGEQVLSNNYILFNNLYFSYDTISIGDNNHDIYFYGTGYSLTSNSENDFLICRFINYQYENILSDEEIKLFIEICPQEYLPIESVTQQTIEGTRYNYDLISPFETFYDLNVNSWYNDLLDTIGLENNSRISNYIFHYPLYLLWFFIFELLEVCLTFIPRCLMSIFKKLSGDSEV